MSKRLCFLVNGSVVEEQYIDFNFVKGLSFEQKVKCANSLAQAIKERYPNLKHLEVSTKSSNELGKQLSAFNLKYGPYSVESVFQSSKVFEGGVRFNFLIDYKPIDAKKYVKENRQGNLIKFSFDGVDYPIDPKSAFYDWIYINALDKSKYASEVLEYDVFSDIEFNDKKSINCQARAVALYVSICRSNKKEYYLSSFDNFKELYKTTIGEQMSLFS